MSVKYSLEMETRTAYAKKDKQKLIALVRNIAAVKNFWKSFIKRTVGFGILIQMLQLK